MNELTIKQQEAYDVLFAYQREYGAPMSTRELQDELGEKSQNGACQKLGQLEKRGLVIRTGKGKARNYIIPRAIALFIQDQYPETLSE